MIINFLTEWFIGANTILIIAYLVWGFFFFFKLRNCVRIRLAFQFAKVRLKHSKLRISAPSLLGRD